MNPVLFEKDETSFAGQGIGTMDCVSCLVTEERNGIYELVAKVHMNSKHFDSIVEGNIIAATHSNQHDRQPFQIYQVTRTLDGFVEIKAEHISYRLNQNTVMPFEASNASAAISGLKTNAVEDCAFTFITDISKDGKFNPTEPQIIRSMLYGNEGSLTDVYGGGEFEFDNFTVKFLEARGNDNGVMILYGKNLTELSKVTDISSIYTAIVPYWKGVDEDQEDILITVPEKVVESQYVNNFPTRRTKPVDLSEKFEDAPTVDQLRAAAKTYVDDNVRQQLLTTIKTSFIELGITDEYKNKVALESVDLCDIVTVSYPAIGVSDKAEVTKVVYNVLLDRNDYVELGDLKKTLSDIFGYKKSFPRSGSKQMVVKEKEKREKEIIKERETSERELQQEREDRDAAIEEAKEECEEKIKELEDKLDDLQFEFPIGYVYLSVVNTNPGTWFKGTWERCSEGYYIKGVEGNAAAEEIGGDLNGHTHDFSVSWKNFISFNVTKGNQSYFRYPSEAAIPGNVKGQTLEAEPLDYVEVNLSDGQGGISVDINQNSPDRSSAWTHGSWKTTNIGETEPAFAEPPYWTVYAWKRVA